MDERAARMALGCVVEAGDPAVARAVALVGPEELWGRIVRGRDDSAWSRRAARLDLDTVRAATERCGARYLIPCDDEWPAALADLAHCPEHHDRGGPPLGLWVRGPARLASERPAVGLVGSRAATSYGQRVAADLAAGLAEAGSRIVSGGAFGIDAAAHRGALAEGGETVAVLACGVDIGYPRAHDALFGAIVESGLLVSELPPGEHPTRVRFLTRNRLIAALAECVVLVEAAARSGARNTVSWAQGCGRVVAAVPGPVSSAQSDGPHQLIRDQGAVLVTSAAEVRELLRGSQPVLPGPRERRASDDWAPERLAVFEAIPATRGADVATVSLRSGLAVERCLAELAELQLAGFVAPSAAGRWLLRRVPGVEGGDGAAAGARMGS